MTPARVAEVIAKRPVLVGREMERVCVAAYKWRLYGSKNDGPARVELIAAVESLAEKARRIDNA